MSAQAQMRAMLDQLMGTSRDGDTTRQRIKFSDDRVCKSHLLNCCPHDVLSGTEKVNLEEEHSSENGQLTSGEVVEKQELLENGSWRMSESP